MTRTTVEQEYYNKFGKPSREIQIFPRTAKNYNIAAEKSVDEITEDIVNTWSNKAEKAFFYCNSLGSALCTLLPDSCTVSEKLNGTYEATFTATIDSDTKSWTYIQEYNYVQIQTQLFFIYKVVHSISNNKHKITAHCQHVSYLLNHLTCLNLTKIDVDIATMYNEGDANYTIVSEPSTVASEYLCDAQSYMRKMYARALDQTQEFTYNGTSYKIDFSSQISSCKFVLSSDIKYLGDTGKTIADKNGDNLAIELGETGRSFMDILINGDDSILGVTDGELYRFNFYVSINKSKEDCKSNMFYFSPGDAVIKTFKREVDYSNYGNAFLLIHRLKNADQASWQLSLASNKMYGANSRIYKATIKEIDETTGQSLLIAEENAKDNNVKIKYTITPDFLKKSDEVDGFKYDFDYRVGDRGYVYDPILKQKISGRITKIVFDAVNNEYKTIEIECNENTEYTPGTNGARTYEPIT